MRGLEEILRKPGNDRIRHGKTDYPDPRFKFWSINGEYIFKIFSFIDGIQLNHFTHLNVTIIVTILNSLLDVASVLHINRALTVSINLYFQYTMRNFTDGYEIVVDNLYFTPSLFSKMK